MYMQMNTLPEIPDSISLTELRSKTSWVQRYLAQKGKSLLLISRSRPIGVLLPMSDYRRLRRPQKKTAGGSKIQLKTVNIGEIKIPLTREAIYGD